MLGRAYLLTHGGNSGRAWTLWDCWCATAADDDTVAESLRQSVRVLCWVMTTPDNHMSRAVHVQATWGRRCNVLLFVTEKDDVGALSVMTVDVATGREHLTAKTMSAFDHVYEHHRNEADWFLKVCQSCRSHGPAALQWLSVHDASSQTLHKCGTDHEGITSHCLPTCIVVQFKLLIIKLKKVFKSSRNNKVRKSSDVKLY